VSTEKQWIKFCMYEAHDVGEPRHPQIAIRAAYPDAEDFWPESIADAWFFRATPREGAQPKPFSLAPRYRPPGS
jgi:hypothetical protein